MPIDLTVVTPEGEAYSGPVDEVVLPGSEGEFGVLESHERFLAPLQPGVLEIRTQSGSQWAAVSDGFADVNAERVVVMVDSLRKPDEIDADAQREAKTNAENELAGLGVDESRRRSELTSIILSADAHLEVEAKR